MLVEVSGQRFVFPQQCACCGKAANTTLQAAHSKSWGKRVVHTKTWSWNFPYCSACLEHIRSWEFASIMALLYAAPVVILALIIGFSASWSDEAKGYGAMIFVALTVVAGAVGSVRQRRKARDKCIPTCTCVARSVSYVNWYGTVHSFDIQSRTYAVLFMLANAKKLINLTEDGRRLMQWGATQVAQSVPSEHDNIRITVTAPTPDLMSPKGVNSDDEQVVRCLARLESLKGTASRRAALEAALKTISGEESRQRLRLDAARIEVTAVLDKVDTMKTAGAKKRHLMAALDDIRSDGIDDSLQLKQIEMLEAALREVERTGL